MLVAVRALHEIVPTVTTFPVADSTVNLATAGLLYPTVNPAATSRPCATYTGVQKLFVLVILVHTQLSRILLHLSLAGDRLFRLEALQRLL